MSDTSKTSEELPIIGILGDGQLAAMMAAAYQSIGGQAYVYGTSRDTPAGQEADQFFIGSPNDIEELQLFFSAVDVVTLENEFYSREQLQELSKHSGTPLYPEPEQYGLIEDKLSEKRFFDSLGVAVAPYLEITAADQLPNEPGFLKIAKGGYDGIGTYKVNNAVEANEIYQRIKDSGQLLFEYAVDYQKELSLLAVGNGSSVVFYPMVETHQDSGTCRFVSYPSGISQELEQKAQDMIGNVMNKFNTRGVFAFELFLTSDGQIIVNESAPRPHNSGHISLDLFNVSQFENHMRAVAGLDLREPKSKMESALMMNLLATKAGEFCNDKIKAQLPTSQLSVKLYGKKSSRPGRKMGHINLWGEDQWQRAQQIMTQLDI